MVQTSVSNANGGWTIEWWAKTYRLFQQTMISLSSGTKTVSFGLSGGGAFNCTLSDGTQNSLAQPQVNTWYLFGAQHNGNVINYYMLQGGAYSASTIPIMDINASAFLDLGVTQVIVGRDPQSYSFQGSIVSPRLCGKQNYPGGISLAGTRQLTSFPLDSTPDRTQVVLTGNPVWNEVATSANVTITGSPTVTAVTDTVDNWVPL